jgi:PKD repeat protein
VEHVYDIQLAYPTDSLITLTWDNTGWSDLGTFSLTDAFDGALGIDIDMTQEDTLTLDNPAFNALKLKVTPQGVAYFSPSAFFTYSTAFLTVTFTDASIPGSSDEIVSWSWDFGDGGDGSTEQNPTNTYDEAGIYEVTLTVTDDNELSDSYTASVTVALPVGPTAEFGYVANQLTVSFADGSEAGDGAITDWSWDFGDNSTSTEQNPIHNYTGYAVYTVSLTVTDENDLQDTIEGDVDVLGGLVIPPFTFYPNPLSGVFFGQVTLDGVSVTEDDVIAAFDPEGNCAGAGIFTVYEGYANIFNFSIFGDDPTTDDFDEGMGAGDEYFTLKLYDESTGNIINYPENFSGWSNQNGAPMPGYDDPYVVYNFETGAAQPPVADFSGVPRSGDVPLTVQFTDESTSGTDTITEWVWVFDVDAFPAPGSQDQNPTPHTYTVPGLYTVRLTVTDENGLESVITKENYILVGTEGVNDAPLATDINVSLMEDETIAMDELYAENSFDADGDELTFSASGAQHGNLPAGGMVYAPDPDYYGFDSFTYTATDPSGLFATATVFVIIIPVDNDLPVAVIYVEGDPEGDGFVETTEDVTLSGWGSYDVDDCPGAPGNTEGCLSFQGSFEWSTVYPPVLIFRYLSLVTPASMLRKLSRIKI